MKDLITGQPVEPWALHFLNKNEDARERLARALSIPEHHTTWELLSEPEKSRFYMQADYALKEIDALEATRTTLVTDELVELREASAFLCQRMREFGGSDLGRLTGAVEQVERIIAAMPAIPPQSLGDHALPPSGLSRCASQAKPAAAIARKAR